MAGNVRKTILVDEKLLRDAKKILGVKTDTEALVKGLELIIRNDAYQQLAALMGSEKGRPIYDVPRRREKPAKKRRVA